MASDSPAHLLDIDSAPLSMLNSILTLAQEMRQSCEPYLNSLPGTLLVNLFYEPSTRTRVSFEVAAMRLGMQVVNIAATDSSVKKGETLLDTFLTLQAMGPQVVVIRHPRDHALAQLAQVANDVHLINAGDGARAHPTQALLDVMTLLLQFGDLTNRTIVIAGDLRHSRVTRSTAALLKRLGVGELRLCAPPGLDASQELRENARCFDQLDTALVGADAIIMLRIQKERLAGLHLPEPRAYHRDWGLTAERLALAAPECRVMHPGPMNRDVEIASEVADGDRSLILEQVANGVWIRMAVIHTLLAKQRS